MMESILRFWFEETAPATWWKKDEDFDRLIRSRFGAIHASVTRCECFAWRHTALGRLAEVIVLDQFSRNMFRDTPQAFAWDSMALALAQEAVSAGADQSLSAVQRGFLYLPYMHSESMKIHETAMVLYMRHGVADDLDYEQRHSQIIQRFGRYPHRNAVLGRASTPEEIEFLKQPGSRF